MRAVVQKVTGATIVINHGARKEIGQGLVILLGIEESDTHEDIVWLSGKISRLRIFHDLSVNDVGGEILVVSQFTLHASTKKGNRPSYVKAASPETAIPLYNAFIEQMQLDLKNRVITGEFGAYMQVNLTNDGPVTLILDSRQRLEPRN